MKKILLLGILSTTLILGTLSKGSATDYNFEVSYNGTDFTLESPFDPLTQSITAGDNFTYTINSVDTEYFEVINATGWNPWLFIYISDTADGVIFDYQIELFLGNTPVLTVPFTGGDLSTATQGIIKSLGVYHGAIIPVGTIFDSVVLSAQIKPTTTTPFTFTDYMPRELAPGWQLAEYIGSGPIPATSSLAISTGKNGTPISDEDAGTYYKKVGIPSINDGKELAFYAQLVIGGKTTPAILSGIDPMVLVRKGDPANGTTSTFNNFKDPLLNNGGDVAIIAQLKGGGVKKKTDYGLWSNGFGAGLQLVAREGDVAMDTGGATIGSFKSVALESEIGVPASVAYHALLKGKGIKSMNNEGLWSYDGTTTRLLLREGQELNIGGTPKDLKSFRVLGQFAKNERLVFGQGFGLANGVISALLSFTDNTTLIASIYTDGIAPVVVAMTGDAAPGFGGGETFKTFMTPGQNSLGGSVFIGNVLPNSPLGSAIYNVDGGAGGVLNRIAVLGEAATGTAGTFTSFDGAVNNGSDQVAFFARIQGAGINKKSDRGIWFFDAPDWVHLAQENGEADMTGGAKWKGFKSLALQENGLPLFVGQLTPNKKTVPKTKKNNDLGLWALDVNGTMQLIVREGVTRVGGKTVKKFKVMDNVKYSPGQARSHNGTNSIIYWAQFTDGTQGIVTVDMPVPVI